MLTEQQYLGYYLNHYVKWTNAQSELNGLSYDLCSKKWGRGYTNVPVPIHEKSWYSFLIERGPSVDGYEQERAARSGLIPKGAMPLWFEIQRNPTAFKGRLVVRGRRVPYSGNPSAAFDLWHVAYITPCKDDAMLFKLSNSYPQYVL